MASANDPNRSDHPRDVADIVADVVSDGSWIARVILRDAMDDLACDLLPRQQLWYKFRLPRAQTLRWRSRPGQTQLRTRTASLWIKVVLMGWWILNTFAMAYSTSREAGQAVAHDATGAESGIEGRLVLVLPSLFTATGSAGIRADSNHHANIAGDDGRQAP